MLLRSSRSGESVEIVVKKLSDLFRVLANSRRVQIVDELRHGERDVSSLENLLELPQSAISKHIAVLRSHRIVVERREGRSVFYRLIDPELASWMLDGIEYTDLNESSLQGED
ncbi:MAG: metalloregulator ArsR/SmtB family transcription factor [Cyanobacteriota/Melainabacteria group bacterium]